MTPKERERMNWLCREIQKEKDHDTFSKLVCELDALFEQKEQRLASYHLGVQKVVLQMSCSRCWV